MASPDFEIPSDRLPDGFAESVERDPDQPADPRAAATVVLMRPSDAGPEVLLLRRNRTVGFVPGAYVFPGGRVDDLDGGGEIARRLTGLSEEGAASRLALSGGDPPAIAYYVAAMREAFEETCILVGHESTELEPGGRVRADALSAARRDLVEGRVTFPEVLDRLDVTLDGGALEYIGHWITPLVEPRRYDTRFFAAAVEADREARPDGGEITRAVWLTPSAALDLNTGGRLPMVFPTIRTLRDLDGFTSLEALFRHFAKRSIPAILPRLVRTPTGVGIEIAEEIEGTP